MSISISGHLFDPSSSATSGGSVAFQLANFGANVPREIGTGALCPTQVTFTASSAGVFSGSLIGNDQIDPGASNTPPTTYYEVSFRDGSGNTIATLPFQFTGSGPANLDSQAPLNVVPSPTTPPNNAALLAANQTFTGNNTFQGTTTLGATLFGSISGSITGSPNFTGTPEFSGGISADGTHTLTLPSSTDTLMGRATTDTESNKTFTVASSGNSVTLLNHQGTTGTTTGTGSAQTVWTYSLPANTMQAGKGIRVRASLNHVAGSNAVNLTFNFGSLQLVASSVGTANNHTNMTFDVFNNNGVTNGQVGTGLWVNSSATATTASAGAVDTTSAVTISIQTTVSSPDTWAGDLFTVELIQ